MKCAVALPTLMRRLVDFSKRWHMNSFPKGACIWRYYIISGLLISRLHSALYWAVCWHSLHLCRHQTAKHHIYTIHKMMWQRCCLLAYRATNLTPRGIAERSLSYRGQAVAVHIAFVRCIGWSITKPCSLNCSFTLLLLNSTCNIPTHC